jgi:hypothetical protein
VEVDKEQTQAVPIQPLLEQLIQEVVAVAVQTQHIFPVRVVPV